MPSIKENLTEPDDMGTDGSPAIRAFGKVGYGLVQRLIRPGQVAAHASRLEERSVHVMYAKGTGALVKVVDVLGAEIESIAQLLFKFCEALIDK